MSTLADVAPWAIPTIVALAFLMILCAAADNDKFPAPTPFDGPEDPNDPLPDVNVRPLAPYKVERELDPDYDPRATWNPSKRDPHIRHRLDKVARCAIVTDIEIYRRTRA